MNLVKVPLILKCTLFEVLSFQRKHTKYAHIKKMLHSRVFSVKDLNAFSHFSHDIM